MPEQNKIPENILKNLRNYKSHKAVTCLTCGYSGHMGVKANIVPWYVSWWVFCLVCLALIPFAGSAAFVWGGIFAVARFSFAKKLVVCPDCSSEWHVKG
ncbi:hypothetical protein MRO89_14500 [Dickeya dianthicola]|uniref:hypothetical protein n=1 Tax=Dickeya dianthicola TaxID=204039 RepID=UPI001F5FF630|nr:hypothetical protein [Dickeya dianthicola]MCI4187161.1 hypothetical protein [Dickeya dianthicola]